MSDELPQGWAATTLGEICSKPQYGWTCRAAKTGQIKYVRTTDISDGGIDWATVPYCEEAPEDVEKYRVTANDILVSRAGSVGVSFRIADVPCDAVFASYLIRFKPLNGIPPKYVEFFLKSDSYWRSISEFSAGIAVPNVNASKLASLELPLPPLGEQRRIVAKLETLLGKVDASQQRLAKIPVLLKRFRQSVLAASCSGRLTADWREERTTDCTDDTDKNTSVKSAKSVVKISSRENNNDSEDLPDGWSLSCVGDVIESLKYGTAQKCGYEKRGVPVLRIPNVANGTIDHADLKYADLSAKELEQLRLSSGDILLIRSNGSVSLVGKCALVRKAEAGFAYAGYLIRLRPNRSLIEPEFLTMSLGSFDIRLQIELQARSTSGVNNINGEEVRALRLSLPPLPEQQEIVRRVEGLFALADQLELRLAKARGQVDQLTPSLLARAFAGQLVPQDPTDEPASMLLQRIHAH